MRAWTQVKVKNEKLEDFGRAGTTRQATPDDAKEIDVMLDGDEQTTTFKTTDLEVLSAG